MTIAGDVGASLRVCLSLLALLLAGGCVTVYQPLTSLQKPTAVQRSETTFAGQRMLIRCYSGDYLNRADAQRLCTKVASLFANQGAEVEALVPYAEGGLTEVAGEPADLIVELRSHLQHLENPSLMWVACALTCSLVPGYTEYSFTQDISIRDADGFELASDSLQARFKMYTGAALWTVNRILDLLVREESEKLTGGAAERDFSHDFYRQLNQLAFNAKVRAEVLSSFQEGS